MKIIPAIDLMDGNVVRLYKGDPKNKTIYSDNPVEIAKKWELLDQALEKNSPELGLMASWSIFECAGTS